MALYLNTSGREDWAPCIGGPCAEAQLEPPTAGPGAPLLYLGQLARGRRCSRPARGTNGSMLASGRWGGQEDGGRRLEDAGAGEVDDKTGDAGKVVRDAYSSYVVQEAPRKNLTALRCKIRTSALGLRNFSPEPIIYRENIFSGGWLKPPLKMIFADV
jgi:hypothetical protein